jgi:hypothetical protein
VSYRVKECPVQTERLAEVANVIAIAPGNAETICTMCDFTSGAAGKTYLFKGRSGLHSRWAAGPKAAYWFRLPQLLCDAQNAYPEEEYLEDAIVWSRFRDGRVRRLRGLWAGSQVLRGWQARTAVALRAGCIMPNRHLCTVQDTSLGGYDKRRRRSNLNAAILSKNERSSKLK